MDLRLLFVFVVICLIGTTHPSGNGDCLCSEIPKMIDTKNPDTCNNTASRFRYECIDGYVRKAGTSNLLKCQNGKWSNSTLECIRHPSLTTGPSETTHTYKAAWTTAKPSTTTQLPNRSETSPGPGKQSSSESTDSERSTPSTPGIMESTTAQYTPQSSTHSAVSTIETNSTQTGEHKSMVTGVQIGVPVVILTVSMIGLIYLCRRRNRRIPISTEAEMEPMKDASAKVP